MTINLNDVQAGDVLTVQDDRKNVLVAPVGVGGSTLHVEAFGTWIEVARVNRNGRMVALPGVRIVGHQPGLL